MTDDDLKADQLPFKRGALYFAPHDTQTHDTNLLLYNLVLEVRALTAAITEKQKQSLPEDYDNLLIGEN